MNIKHSKYKNTGILFELLVRQVTADTLNGVESAAIKLIQKYFVKSELGKEYKLYEALTKTTTLTESKANVLIQTLLESSKKLNRRALKKEKYNLINEIKTSYNLEEFFKTKLPHYKVHAAYYMLSEVQSTEALVDTDIIVSNKMTLLEHLSTSDINGEKVEAEVLREFYNTEVDKIKAQLNELSSQITDKAVQIKINEVNNIIETLDKTVNVTSDNIVNILQYLELVEELKTAHG